MRLNDQELAQILNTEIARANGYDSDELASQRQADLNLYRGELPPPPGIEGRATIVSTDVADAVRATLAQICPVIRTSQIEFPPNSQEDEVQAQLETDFVQAEIERRSGYDTIDAATFDALLLGNGWIDVQVNEEVTKNRLTYPGNLSEAELYALDNSLPPDTTAEYRAGKDETRVTLITTNKSMVIECVPPEHMIYSEQGSDYDIDTVRFVARRRIYTRGTLISAGIDRAKVTLLPQWQSDMNDWARSGNLSNADTNSAQWSNELVEVYCCYIRVSYDDDGVTELRHVWIGRDQTNTLKDEPAQRVSYICGSAVPMPHRIKGTSFGELVSAIQYGKTHVLRSYMDNLTVMNGSRVAAVEGQVNMGDLTNGRLNGVVRVRSPDAIMPLPAADIGPQAVGALNYLDSVRTARVGAAIDFSEAQAQLMSTSATAAAGQLAKVESMSGWFAGNIVRTLLLPLFTLVHYYLRTEFAGPRMAKISGKWEQTDTGQWQERKVTDIHMGLTSTERAERMLALSQTVQQLQAMIASGGAGIITDLPRLYAAMSDWIRTANLGGPDQYLIDPKSQEAQQAIQQQNDNARQMKEEQVRIQSQLIRLEQDFQLEKQRRDLEYKTWSDKLDAEVKEAELVSNGAIEIKKISANADNVNRKMGEDDAD